MYLRRFLNILGVAISPSFGYIFFYQRLCTQTGNLHPFECSLVGLASIRHFRVLDPRLKALGPI